MQYGPRAKVGLVRQCRHATAHSSLSFHNKNNQKFGTPCILTIYTYVGTVFGQLN